MHALIIVDMQSAYFADKNLKEQKSILIKNIQYEIDKHLRMGNLIVNVKTIHSHDKKTWTLNMLEDNQGFLFENSEETETLLKLPGNTEYVYKSRDSAFHETNLIDMLRANNITHISLVGVSAHTCIFHTASAAYAYNLKATLIRDAIGDENMQAMQRAFDYLTSEYRQLIS